MAELVLFVEAFWTSPWVCSVFVALREKGLAFTTSTAMVRHGRGAVDALHGMSLTGTAPVLQHDDLYLAESLAIVEYLDETWPSPRMLPASTRDRARARQLMGWLRSDAAVPAFQRDRPAERIFYPDEPLPLSSDARSFADRLLAVATRLRASGGDWLFGAFGVVDVEIAFALMRLVAAGDTVPEALATWARSVWARPSVRDFVEHARPPNRP